MKKQKKVLESDLVRLGIPGNLLACKKNDLSSYLRPLADVSLKEIRNNRHVIFFEEAGADRDKFCVVLSKRLIAIADRPSDVQIVLFESTLLDTYTASRFDDDMAAHTKWAKWQNAQYLILGGMDGENSARNLYKMSVSCLIQERIVESRPTFIATSLTEEQIFTFYGSDVSRAIQGYFLNVNPS